MSGLPWQNWTPPEVFDDYRLLRPIGRGGMGHVYLGHDLRLDRPVAIKLIGTSDPDAASRQRFLIEARAIARLQHPNVVAIYRVGEVDGHPYLSSELVRGRSLNLLPRPVPWQRVLRIGIGLARGLAAAHAQGVLHRDIKPANVMISDTDEVKLLDFGLAKLAGEGDTPLLSGAGPHGAAGAQDAHGNDGPLTEQGAVLGTPMYMARETLRGEPATQRSDVYSLGAVLYELCAGQPPRFEEQEADTLWPRASRDGTAADPPEPRPLHPRVPGMDPDLSAIVQRCLRNDPALRFATAAELRDALEALAPEARTLALPEGNPYRGLLSFEAEHRDLFFGRGPETRAVLERLRGESLLLITGDSGVGKSSLCRAGILPLCSEGALHDRRSFTVLLMYPGKHPLSALGTALSPYLNEPEDRVIARLGSQPSALCRDLQKRAGPQGGVVLFIDQLEELFTLSDPVEARLMGTILGDLAAPSPGVRVLLTARSDFLTRVAMLPGLAEEVPRCLYFLRALSPQGAREAITGPARKKGYAFESEDLVGTLVASATQAGSLPLLQFALAELWEARDRERHLITRSALSAIGGVGGALACHADAVLVALPPEQRQAARRILTRLVTVEGTRACRTQDELGPKGPATTAALEVLIKSRLLSARQAEGHTFYEVAHEALISGWGTLHGWLDAEADIRAARHRIETAAAEWERLLRAPDVLWGRRQLREAALVDAADLSPREVAFLMASRRSALRLHLVRRGLLIGLPLLAVLTYGIVRHQARVELRRTIAGHVAQAQASLGRAREEAGQGAALRQRALALFDEDGGGPRIEAERLWRQGLSLDQQAERSYIDASQVLETTLMLDVGRGDVRGLLGDVTYERTLLAERMHAGTTRDELAQRLRNYDAGGERRRRLAAPARLRLLLTPADAQVRVQRYQDQAGRLVLRDVSSLAAPGPGNGLVLRMGSYLLTLRAAGRPELRLPVLLGRGESREIAVTLPAQLPPGYIYIPPGRFLYGSADDESLRTGFFKAVPLHPVETAGYLIGRTEVSFADWIQYLKDLPDAERARRTPGVQAIRGGVSLQEQPSGGFRLSFQRNTITYTARSGEPIHYAGRSRRAVQDWLRFPVSAISFDDAQAYTRWLDRTGRVPGARLCDEHEWERAARGADDRVFPGGNRMDPDDANIDETYGRQAAAYGPDEVGSHPASESPFGVMDMAGNVLEWTRSARRPVEAMIRGGSWYHDQLSSRSNNREPGEPTLRDLFIGMRVCASFPLP